MSETLPFALKYENVWIVPALHYNFETAAHTCQLFQALQPDCVAVELAETLQTELVQAARRLPDISVVTGFNRHTSPFYYLSEPGDAAFEALRSALEKGSAAYCIDLDVDFYPDLFDLLPDPYAIARLGLEKYWQVFHSLAINPLRASHHDEARELHMARRLKELSLQYEKVLCVCGIAHAARILGHLSKKSFPIYKHATRDRVEIYSLSEESVREVLTEGGYFSTAYECARKDFLKNPLDGFRLDRHLLLFELYKISSLIYIEKHKGNFSSYHLRTLMKFSRNYALVTQRLNPSLFQILTAAKACVDHNYAYEVWKLATAYPFLKNIDNLPEIHLSPEDIWGSSQRIKFRLLEKNAKGSFFQRIRKDKQKYTFAKSGLISFCSYPPEDLAIEAYGKFLKKKGFQLLSEENARSVPFSNSLEDGIDTRETIRHWTEHKLYVKLKGKPPQQFGSVVVIFDEDKPKEDQIYQEKYPWCVTWHGEHNQESDMAFYATPFGQEIIGPGICRCEYGGFMLTYPPRRVFDVWTDPDYSPCQSKAEVLLAAAIDYSVTPNIVYLAPSPPPPLLKSYASRYGKKVVYLPFSQFPAITLNKLRKFHVLDSHEKRRIADDYIF